MGGCAKVICSCYTILHKRHEQQGHVCVKVEPGHVCVKVEPGWIQGGDYVEIQKSYTKEIYLTG